MEFGMQNNTSFNSQPMEWYSSPQMAGGPPAYNSSQYQYAPPPQAHTSTAYASFEDEPPLLEGMGSVHTHVLSLHAGAFRRLHL